MVSNRKIFLPLSLVFYNIDYIWRKILGDLNKNIQLPSPYDYLSILKWGCIILKHPRKGVDT